jgi:hypothetical protein
MRTPLPGSGTVRWREGTRPPVREQFVDRSFAQFVPLLPSEGARTILLKERSVASSLLVPETESREGPAPLAICRP